MGEREIGLLGAMVGLMSLAVVGANLVSAIWAGRRPRGGSFATALATLAGATAVVSLTPHPEQSILVAAASEAPEPCVADVHVVRTDGEWQVTGLPGSQPCAVWAIIEDPRTGVHWVQGPALRSTPDAWFLPVSVGTGRVADGALPYRLNVVTLPADGPSPFVGPDHPLIIIRDFPDSARWVLRDMPVTAGGPYGEVPFRDAANPEIPHQAVG